MNNTVAALIVAAGTSRRMAEVCDNKLLLKINGIEVLARAMLQYEKAQSINSIYVVTQAELIPTVEAFADTYGIRKFKGCTVGGPSRQHSVQNGLSLCKEESYVAIADGARPFTAPQHIDQVSAAAIEHGGALLGVPAKDTIKKLSADGFVECTPPRAQLFQAQTPQTFHKDTFIHLMDQAMKDERVVTDDASVLELYGHKVFPVIGEYNNIKITTKEDIALADAIVGKDTL